MPSLHCAVAPVGGLDADEAPPLTVVGEVGACPEPGPGTLAGGGVAAGG